MAGGFRPRRRLLVALSTVVGLLVAGWLATLPWLVGRWPAALAVGLVLVVVVVPRWVVPARSAATLAGIEDPAARGRLEDDRLRLQNELRVGLLQAVAGVAVIAAVVVTWLQLGTDRRLLREQLAAAGRDQASERFALAMGQLGSEQLDLRLAGIYGLERIAARASEHATTAGGAAPRIPPEPDPSLGAFRMSPEPDPSTDDWAAQDRVQVFEILSAYVRTTSRRPPIGPPGATSLAERHPDVQAAAAVLGRRRVLDGDLPLDLSGSLLPVAQLGRARFPGADLRGADLRGTSLQHADLAGAQLDGSLLCGTRLQGADLRGADLAGAKASAGTGWPSGFDWRAAGVRQVEFCMP
jgi:Pentapeptide repeats (8 copies)